MRNGGSPREDTQFPRLESMRKTPRLFPWEPLGGECFRLRLGPPFSVYDDGHRRGVRLGRV